MFKSRKSKKIEQDLTSESFINYVLGDNLEDVTYWEQWIAENPRYHGEVQRSIVVIKSLDFNQRALQDKGSLSSWQVLQRRIRKETYYTHKTPVITARWALMAAVAFICIIVGSLYWFKFHYNPIVNFNTDIAQNATINLPDGSEVILHKNSSIRFYKSWDRDTVRKVWLDGEAYFRVRPNPRSDGSYRRFEVHTAQLLINVVGTVFSVNTNEGDYVMLESGRVDIQKKGEGQVYTLKPGQSAQISASGDLVMNEPSKKPRISWVDGKILLNDNALYEIIEFMEESYGLQVECSNEALLHRKLSGQVRLDNIEDLLNVLKKVLDLVVEREGNTVKIIANNKHSIHV